MGAKKIYNCDICRDEKDPDILFGIFFSDLRTFTISSARSTDGVHICVGCMQQLKDQIAKLEIPLTKPRHQKRPEPKDPPVEAGGIEYPIGI